MNPPIANLNFGKNFLGKIAAKRQMLPQLAPMAPQSAAVVLKIREERLFRNLTGLLISFLYPRSENAP